MLSSRVPMQCELIETDTPEKFIREAANLLEKQIASALTKSGRCVLGLSGGKTPLAIYATLAERPLEWQNVWVFLVDERYVAPDHEESNQRAIRQTLIEKVGLPPVQFIAPDTWKPLPECVDLYEAQLKDLFAKGQADLVTLGMGEDGSIASLFPPVPPEAFEAGRLVMATRNEGATVPDRVTVTIPVLTEAETPVLLLAGRLKKRAWTKMLEAGLNSRDWPAHAVLATGRAIVVAEWSPSGQENL